MVYSRGKQVPAPSRGFVLMCRRVVRWIPPFSSASFRRRRAASLTPSREREHTTPMPSLDSRREPLLGSSGHSRTASSHGWSAAAKLCVLPSFVLAYVVASTIERVVFARMAASMHGQVLLMHTALAAFNTLLFMLLRLARSQSSRSVVSATLHPNPSPSPSPSPSPNPDPGPSPNPSPNPTTLALALALTLPR